MFSGIPDPETPALGDRERITESGEQKEKRKEEKKICNESDKKSEIEKRNNYSLAVA